jgi:Zn-dependent peptidase ImmA (M78 family)
MTIRRPEVSGARARAHELLEQHGIAQPPVDVAEIAAREGIEVQLHELGDDVSGMLVQTPQGSFIGINARHHPNRQRFTIAHEIAHSQLHPNTPTVYVDGMMMHFRGEQLARAEPIEVEANAFAAALLMPEHFLRNDLRHRTIDLFDEAAVKQLAQRYKVSPQALTYRLMELNLLGGGAPPDGQK